MKTFIQLYCQLHQGMLQVAALIFLLGIAIWIESDKQYDWLFLFISVGGVALHFLTEYYKYIGDDDNFSI